MKNSGIFWIHFIAFIGLVSFLMPVNASVESVVGSTEELSSVSSTTNERSIVFFDSSGIVSVNAGIAKLPLYETAKSFDRSFKSMFFAREYFGLKQFVVSHYFYIHSLNSFRKSCIELKRLNL